MKQMNRGIIDLFSGVGGLSLGFRQAGFPILLANEIDPSIAKSYKKNHPDTLVINQDITRMNIKKVFAPYKDKVIGVVGGPPCQGFSQKGQRKSILDKRNFLFLYFVKVVDFLRPNFFLMENVPNLLTVEEGYFKKEIEKLFLSMGYSLSIDTVNACDFGVPQNRRRAIILGHKGTKKIPFPQKIRNCPNVWDAISDLAFLDSGDGNFEMQYRLPSTSSLQHKLKGKSKILYNHQATKHSDSALKRLKLIPAEKGKEFLPKHMLTKSIYSGTWTRLNRKDIANTITTRFDTPSSGRFTHPYLNRAITVREAARLQTFPDNFIFYGSKMSQMKQVGNAVPPFLAYAFAKQIKKNLGD